MTIKNNSKIKKPVQKIFNGLACQDSSFNTVKVKVKSIKVHPIYLGRYFKFKNYLVQTDKEIKKGEKVKFVLTKPISKRKSWKVVE